MIFKPPPILGGGFGFIAFYKI